MHIFVHRRCCPVEVPVQRLSATHREGKDYTSLLQSRLLCVLVLLRFLCLPIQRLCSELRKCCTSMNIV